MIDDPYTAIEKLALHRCRPLRAQLELTYRCNFRCVMCYLVEFKSPGELTLPEYERVLDQLAEMGCMSVTLTGGEPLLRKDFFEIAEAARERNFALRIFTNGSLIDEERAKRIRELNPLAVELSVYGASDESYRRVTTTKTKFDTVASAVRRLRALDVPVALKTPVVKQNVGDIDALVDLAKETNCRILMNPNITPRDDGSFAPLDHALDDDQMVEYLQKYVAPREDHERDGDDHMCNSARSSLVVSPVGDVFPCVQIKESVGNVRERSLQEIWRSGPLLDEIRAIRVKHHPKNVGTSTPCASDGCGSSCSAQCAGVARMATGSLTGGDPLARRMLDLKSRAHGKSRVPSY